MSRTICLIALLALLSTSWAHAQYAPGQTYFGTNDYIEYHAGDLPIIVSAPHGGYLEPATIPDRSCSGCVTGRDSRTEEMIYQIDSAVQVLFGGHPHIIINKLARVKLDANREIVEASQGDPASETAWAEYHNFIQAAKDSARAQFGSALYIDLHGHGHTIQRLELGYLITRTELQQTDAVLDAQNFQDSSSLKHLTNILNPAASFADILRGNECMGEFMVEHGYPSTPSATDPAPAPTDPYWSGGYNTVRHGSRDSSDFSGIQFELNWTGVRDNTANRAAFARSLACAMRDYLDRWFLDLDAWTPGHQVTSTADHGPGTLRDALMGAEDGDLITFDPGLNGDTIHLEKELRICSEVTIQGPGAGLLAVSGGDSTRLVRIMPTDSVTITGLSLVEGNTRAGEDGGGLFVEGTLRLVHCVVSENFADDDGGGIVMREEAKLYLDSSRVTNNLCGDDGAGIRNFGGSLFITHSTISRNACPSFGGGISSSGTVNISQSTFNGNTAATAGGGIRSFGGTLTVENSTFWLNISGDRGGAISASIDVDLNFCTLVKNTASGQGGAVRLDGSNCTLENTLVAGNLSPLGPNLGLNGGTYTSNGYNFIGDSTGSAWVPAMADQLGSSTSPLDPLVLSLMNNGGPTETIGLDPNSPCLDAANGMGAPATDQRGMMRIVNNEPDIGAFEYLAPVAIQPGASDQIVFQLFPNPASDHVTFQFSEKGDYQLTVGNMLGQTVWQTEIKEGRETSINISDWPKGIYWVKPQDSRIAARIFQVQ